MKTISNKIINRIYRKGRGWCFTSRNFYDLGSPEAIRINLYRLEKNGIIRRLRHGLYEYPKKHPSIGMLSPSPQKIAEAIKFRDAVNIQPSGAFAANMLGLSEQVPAKIVFLTNGPSRRLKIGNQEIVFKKTSNHNFAMKNKFSGLLIQALRFIGKERINKQDIEHLKHTIDDRKKKALDKDKIYAPGWMYPILNSITGDRNA